MTNKRKIQAEETRIALIETAFDLNKYKNYSDISIDEICEKLHLTKGAFYHHFKSKDEVFYWVYKKSEDIFLEERLNKYFDTEDASTLFKKYFTTISSFKKQDIQQARQQYKVLLSMDIPNEELLKSKSANYLYKILKKGKDTGEFITSLPLEYCQNIIYGTMTGIYMQWCILQLYDIDVTINQLCDIWLNTLKSRN